nr:hypothetical protein [Micromonospora sp. DSM 115978]
VVVAVASWLGGLVSTLAMIALGQAVLGAYDVPTAGLGDGDVVRVVLAGTLLAPLFPLVGLALGIVLRGTAGAVTTVLALIFAPAVLGELLPRWWRENVLALLPGPASDSVILSHVDEADWYLSPGLGMVAVAVWLVVFLGGAYLALTRRDA